MNSQVVGDCRQIVWSISLLHFLNNLILLYRKKCLISAMQNFKNFRTNVSIKLIHRAYFYLTIGHEGLGFTGSSVQSNGRVVI